MLCHMSWHIPDLCSFSALFMGMVMGHDGTCMMVQVPYCQVPDY